MRISINTCSLGWNYRINEAFTAKIPLYIRRYSIHKLNRWDLRNRLKHKTNKQTKNTIQLANIQARIFFVSSLEFKYRKKNQTKMLTCTQIKLCAAI